VAAGLTLKTYLARGNSIAPGQLELLALCDLFKTDLDLFVPGVAKPFQLHTPRSEPSAG
jgi:hypothetical protein